MVESKSCDSYKKLGIVELREVGKRVGIKSPTTLDKKTLLNQIMSIVKGNGSEIISGGKENALSFDASRVDDSDRLNLMIDFERAELVSGQHFSGYVWVFDGAYGRISRNLKDNDDDIYLSQTLIAAYRLRPGDYIEGKKVLMSHAMFYGAYCITSVNGELIGEGGIKNQKDFLRAPFDAHESAAPDTKLVFRSKSNLLYSLNLVCPPARGQRMMFTCEESAEREILASVLFSDTVPYTQCDIVELMSGGEEKLSEIPPEKQYLWTDFGSPCEDSIRLLERATERAKRNAENGKDGLLVIFGLNKLITRLRFIDKISQLERVIKCVMSGKRMSGKGSLTIIFAVSAKYADIFKGGVSADAVFLNSPSGIMLDIKNSYVARPETYLDAAELDAMRKVKRLSQEVTGGAN